MGENFFININCSRIISDGDEAQYTMFIDNTKMSIVYELVEWIRWMFSIEYCIYFSHENSVIHELEDIQLLSKLKNLEIKPCGRSQCVHKKSYRVLLNNLNLFVCWNEVKVHKYFVDKINQIDQKLTQESNRTNTSMISSSIKAYEDLMNCKNNSIRTINEDFFLSDNQLSNSSIKQSPLSKKTSVIDNSESEPTGNGRFKLDVKPCFNKSKSAKSSLENELEVVQVANNSYKTSKSKKSSKKYFKPFSVGEILSNIRRDFEKQNAEVTTKKEVPPVNFSLFEGDFNNKMITENSPFISEDKVTEVKKRQRTRRRNKSKRQNLGNETFTLPLLENNDAINNINCLKSNSTIKPNHIRFDTDDEDNIVDNNCVKGNISTQNKSEYEIIHEKMDDLNSLTFFKAEGEKSSTAANDNYQGLSDSQLLNSPVINSENKMECSSAADNLIQIEEQQSDQTSNNINQICDKAENFQSGSFNSDLNILVSLKENCRNSLVVKRFY